MNPDILATLTSPQVMIALMVAAGRAGVPVTTVGKFTGDVVSLGGSSAPLADLSAIYRGAFGDTFA